MTDLRLFRHSAPEACPRKPVSLRIEPVMGIFAADLSLCMHTYVRHLSQVTFDKPWRHSDRCNFWIFALTVAKGDVLRHIPLVEWWSGLSHSAWLSRLGTTCIESDFHVNLNGNKHDDHPLQRIAAYMIPLAIVPE